MLDVQLSRYYLGVKDGMEDEKVSLCMGGNGNIKPHSSRFRINFSLSSLQVRKSLAQSQSPFPFTAKAWLSVPIIPSTELDLSFIRTLSPPLETFNISSSSCPLFKPTMVILSILSLVVAFATIASVNAHGVVSNIMVNGKS